MCFWSQVVNRKTKSYTSKPNCDENSLRYLNKNKKMSKQESDVRLSVESPTVRTEMSDRQISLGVKEEGTLLVIEICPGTACLVLQWTPAVRVDSPLLTDRVMNLTMIWLKFEKLRIFEVMKEVEWISVVNLYQCVRVITSRMLTFPKVCDLFCVMLLNNRRKCLILYEKLCDVAIVWRILFYTLFMYIQWYIEDVPILNCTVIWNHVVYT